MLRFLGKPFRFLFSPRKIFLAIVVISAVTLAYCVYLDFLVTKQFEGKRFSLPARVFARPLELFEGKPLTLEALKWELKLIRYKPVSSLSGSGQFAVKRNRVFINTKPFTFWDGEQPAQKLSFEIHNGKVRALVDRELDKSLDIARLEPLIIGGIYPDKNEDRELVRLNQLPPYFIEALVAVEDQRFFQHHGVDPKAILRAAFATLSGKGIQGGSTVTQQLVKNFFLTPDRTLWRKFNEMLMAILLERRYEKKDILETYFNEVYFGQDRTRAIHGVALASQFYFGRNVEQMELHQAATLIAMLKGPALYNPRRHPERVTKRRNLVMAEMLEQGFISKATYNLHRQMPLGLAPSQSVGASRYPAFMDVVFQQLRRDYKESDLRSEGLRIFTTLDPQVQNTSEKALVDKLKSLEKNQKLRSGKLDGAVVVSSAQTGELLAVVGGRRVRYQGFNRALGAKRQVGSLIKPAIYLAALEQPHIYSLATLLDDSPLVWVEPGIGPWEPENYDQQFHGEVPLWLALAKSYNVAAARLGLQIGVDNVIATVGRLGVESKVPQYASTLLGTASLTPLEVAQMYQTLAADGFRIPLRAIREVLTLQSKPLKRYGLDIEQTVNSEAAYLIKRGLQLVMTEGTGVSARRYIKDDLLVAGKTGTTDDFRDSWFAGFSGDKVGVVWVGTDDNKNTGLTGASGALQVWGSIFSQVAEKPLIDYPPQGVVSLVSDRKTGARVREGCNNTLTLPFIKGYEPQVVSGCQKAKGNKVKKKGWFGRLFGG